MGEPAFFAGMLIGIGDVALVSCDNKYVGAFLFSVALLSIIKLGLPLYTGRVGRVVKDKTYLDCVIYLVFNIFGTSIPLVWLILAGKYDQLASISLIKFSKSAPELILAAILCNVLIHVAVRANNDLVTVLCVMMFILCGFEHCIADAPFILLCPHPIITLFSIILGNTIGAILTEFLIGENK